MEGWADPRVSEVTLLDVGTNEQEDQGVRLV
jgi:hypothetical protein